MHMEEWILGDRLCFELYNPDVFFYAISDEVCC